MPNAPPSATGAIDETRGMHRAGAGNCGKRTKAAVDETMNTKARAMARLISRAVTFSKNVELYSVMKSYCWDGAGSGAHKCVMDTYRPEGLLALVQ